MKKLKKLLSDNRADMNMEHMIIIVIAFVAGAILLTAIWWSINKYFPTGLDTNIHDYLA